MKMKEKVMNDFIAEIAELKQQRDDAANSALGHAAKYNNVIQAITDPENQPSQYGTVTLAMHNELKQQRDELAERIKELEAALESRKSTNAGWNAYYALRQRIDDVEAAERQEPVAECTDDDKWNCKYCSKTKTCKALQDKRNFTTPQPAPAWQPIETAPKDMK